MIRTLATTLLLTASFSTARSQDGGLPADFARLVPADAVVLLQLRSVGELAGIVEHVRARSAPEADEMAASELVTGLMSALGIDLDASTLDMNMPLGVSFAIDPQILEPQPTFILPATQADALIASLELPEEELFTTRAGAYVAISMGAAPDGEPSRLARGAPEGLFTARVDMASLYASFRPMIEAQLDQLEMMIGTGALEDPSMPFDMGPMMQWYLDLVWDILDSVDLLDFALDLTGSDVISTFTLSNHPGSPLAEMARPETIDYRAALGAVDPEAPMQMVSCVDQSTMMDSMWDMYAGMATALEAEGDMPEEFAQAFRVYIDGLKEMMTHVGRFTVASLDFAPGGLRMAALYHPEDPTAFMQSWLGLLRDPALAEIGVRTSEPLQLELAGLTATTCTTQLDLRKLRRFFSMGEDISAEEMAEGEELLERIIGAEGLRSAMLPLGERLGLFVGGDASWQAASAARMQKPTAPAPHLAAGLEQLGDANPGMLMYFDLSRGMGRILELMASFDAPGADQAKLARVLNPLGDVSAPIWFYWGVRGATMKSGIGANLEGILRLIEAIAEEDSIEEQRLHASYDIYRISAALDRFAAMNDGQLPDSLEILTIPDESGGFYLLELPVDPWGRPYRYTPRPAEGVPYVITSLGADGEVGGYGADADISNLDEEPAEDEDDAPFSFDEF